MKRLKKNQMGPWCSFCPEKTTRAVYREDGFAKVFSCADHKEALKDHERVKSEREDRMTEADYQTWHKL